MHEKGGNESGVNERFHRISLVLLSLRKLS